MRVSCVRSSASSVLKPLRRMKAKIPVRYRASVVYASSSERVWAAVPTGLATLGEAGV